MEASTASPVLRYAVLAALTIFPTIIAVSWQWRNQFLQFRQTQKSVQRRLCFAVATSALAYSISLVLVACLTTYFFSSGQLQPGKLRPGAAHPVFAVVTVTNYLFAFTCMALIVAASLHRYHRLCSVYSESLHGKIFLVGLYGTIASSVLAFCFNTVDVLVYEHVLFQVGLSLTIAFPVVVDFLANFLVFS